MILPIRTLFGRPGNPGAGGVPALSIEPWTGEIVGAGFNSGAGGSGGSSDSGPGASETSSEPGAPGMLPGSEPSGFDRWRLAGRPTRACPGGMGAYTLPDGTPCDPGMSSPAVCQDTTQRILNAIAIGASTAAQLQQPQTQYVSYPASPPQYPYPAYQGGASGGSVTVSGSANPAAWLFGMLLIGGVVVLAMRR